MRRNRRRKAVWLRGRKAVITPNLISFARWRFHPSPPKSRTSRCHVCVNSPQSGDSVAGVRLGYPPKVRSTFQILCAIYTRVPVLCRCAFRGDRFASVRVEPSYQRVDRASRIPDAALRGRSNTAVQNRSSRLTHAIIALHRRRLHLPVSWTSVWKRKLNFRFVLNMQQSSH